MRIKPERNVRFVHGKKLSVFLAIISVFAFSGAAFAQEVNVSTIPGDQRAAFVSASAPTIKSIEAQVATLVNKERTRRGLAPLKHVADVSNVARIKSQDMIKRNYFSHTSPTYGSPFKMMESFGIRYTAAGENIAKGQQSAQAVMNSWMGSAGHRNNICSPIFTQIGIGVAKLSNGTYCWTQMFVKR